MRRGKGGGVGSNQYAAKGVSRAAPRSRQADTVTAVLAEYADPDLDATGEGSRCGVRDGREQCYEWTSRGVCPTHGLVRPEAQVTENELIAAAFSTGGTEKLLGTWTDLNGGDVSTEEAASWLNTGLEESQAEELIEKGWDPAAAVWWLRETKLPFEVLADWENAEEAIAWTEAGVPTAWEAQQWDVTAAAKPGDVAAARARGWGAAAIALQGGIGCLDAAPAYLTHRTCGARTAYGGTCPRTLDPDSGECGHDHSRGTGHEVDLPDEHEVDRLREEAEDQGGYDNMWFVTQTEPGRWFGHKHDDWDESDDHAEAWEFTDHNDMELWVSAQREEDEQVRNEQLPDGVVAGYQFPHQGWGEDYDPTEYYAQDLDQLSANWRVTRSDSPFKANLDDISTESMMEEFSNRYADGAGYSGSSSVYLTVDGKLVSDDGGFEAIPLRDS